MTSLNEALTNLGELMAENLTTQGVPSTYEEGLTTLAGKILDIQGGGSTYDGISISANTIVEKGNTLTLTSQLTLNGIPVTVPNISIDWYEDGTLFDTILTDANGQTTYTYSATGTGDIPIKAQTDSLEDTVTVEDCWKYDNTNYSSVVDVHYSLPTGDYSISFDTYTNTTATANNQAHLDLGVVANRIICGTHNSQRQMGLIEVRNSTTIQTQNNGTQSVNILTSHVVKYENGVFTHTVDGNTVSMTPQYIIPIEITTVRVGSNQRLNNLKIKPL